MRIHRFSRIVGLLLIVACLAACQADGSTAFQGLQEFGADLEALAGRVPASGPGAYASKVSVAPGESIAFHISGRQNGKQDAKIWREGNTRVLMDVVANVSSGNYGCTGNYATGCDWPVAFTYQIPNSWESGVYTMEVPDPGGGTNKAIFWVREKVPGARSKVLFLASVNTYQAYNNYSGGSLYSFGGSKKSPKVTFDRPYPGGVGLYSRWEEHFVKWLDRENYAVEYATTYDLDFDPNLLSHYDVAIIAGHSEYWTWAMRDQVRQFIQNGGRFMNLSGNTMWWQVRFEDNGRTMVGYKDWRADPVKSPQLATDYNWEYPIFDSMFPIIGLNFRFGGYPGGSGNGFQTINANHWVFDGTGLRENELFGKGPTRDTSIHDKESDGMPLNCAPDGNTILGAPGRNMSPANFTVLGIVPLEDKQRNMSSFGEMGIYTLPSGGAVFSAGTTGWILGLDQPEVAKITRNVLDKFIAGNFPQEPTNPDAEFLFYDRFNCNDITRGRFPASAAVNIVRQNYTISAGITTDAYTSQCGVEGSGLRIPVILSRKGHRFANPISVNWEGYNQLYSRMYLDLQGLKLKEKAVVNVVEQYADNRVDKLAPVAVLQISMQNGKLVMRYQPANENLPWVPVPGNKGFWVETEWNAPADKIRLNADGSNSTYNVALGQLPDLNRFDFGILKKQGTTSGEICIDELAYNDQPIN